MATRTEEPPVSNVETVQQICSAFRRGDVAAIIEKLDPNVEWDTEVLVDGVSWLQPRRGAANLRGFFEALAPLNITRFDPHTLFTVGNKVFALIAIEGKNRPANRSICRTRAVLWVFNDAGKVVKYQHVTDTAMHWRMANQ